MINELIPAPARVEHAFVDYESSLLALYPDEAVAVTRALPKRKREYASVRMCARRAMSALGVPASPLLSGPRGAPQWPAGLVGSMTHCLGFRAAAVARASDFRGLGLDAEPNEPLPPDLLEFISLPQERTRVHELAGMNPEIRWDRLLFSAKEAVFKVWYPITQRELGFEQADIRIGARSGTFTAQLSATAVGSSDEFPNRLNGRWRCRDGFILTAIALRTRRGLPAAREI
ncbi:4'-phosphopantetheinyl transferase family protein [Streptomyces vastus]|uniref:4'-phosphopantetheinyl transferase superfamily protein n=1 Tax=Streptomyces vastus TaxID=285451 RepID=A0ABN3QF03_9ACTN